MTAVAPAAGAATIYGTLVQYTASATEVPADGLSYIDLTFSAPTGDASTGTVGVTTSAGTFTTGSGLFAGSATNVYPKTSVQAVQPTVGGSLRLTSPLAAGSTTVSVSYTVNGVALDKAGRVYTANTGTGDPLRTAFGKINGNFVTLSGVVDGLGGGSGGITNIAMTATNLPAGSPASLSPGSFQVPFRLSTRGMTDGG